VPRSGSGWLSTPARHTLLRAHTPTYLHTVTHRDAAAAYNCLFPDAVAAPRQLSAALQVTHWHTLLVRTTHTLRYTHDTRTRQLPAGGVTTHREHPRATHTLPHVFILVRVVGHTPAHTRVITRTRTRRPRYHAFSIRWLLHGHFVYICCTFTHRVCLHGLRYGYLPWHLPLLVYIVTHTFTFTVD